MTRTGLIYVWEEDSTLVPQLVQLFLDTVDASYISAGELQEGRAVSEEAWDPELRTRLEDELTGALSPGSAQRVLVAWNWSEPVGVALVKFCLEAPRPYAVLEDLVVRRQDQRQGIGRQLMELVATRAAEAGCQHLYLESGAGNHVMHRAAPGSGFRLLSHTYVRAL